MWLSASYFRSLLAVTPCSLLSVEACVRLWDNNKQQDSFSAPDKPQTVLQLDTQWLPGRERHKGKMQHETIQWQGEKRNGTTQSKPRPLCRLILFYHFLVVDTEEAISNSCWFVEFEGCYIICHVPKKGALPPSLKALWSPSVLSYSWQVKIKKKKNSWPFLRHFFLHVIEVKKKATISPF